MKSIVALAFLLTLCLLPAACGDDNSVTGEQDEGTSITCEDVCTVAVQCYHEAGESLEFEECVDDCIKDDKIERFPIAMACQCNANSCEEFWKCFDEY